MEVLGALLFLIFVIFTFIIPALLSIIRVINHYERGIRLRLGSFTGKVEEPGIKLLIPIVDKLFIIDIRERPLDLPSQEIITADNITIKVGAVVYFQVVEPDKSLLQNQDYVLSVFQLAQTTLRNVIGQSELDEILQAREKINERIRDIIDENTHRWGIKVTLVEIKDIELPQGLQKAMAKQAEAERERRAKIISAEAEYQAAQKLVDAAKLLGSEPVALQLRLFQLLSDISSKGTNIVIPLPTDLFNIISQRAKMSDKETNINN